MATVTLKCPVCEKPFLRSANKVNKRCFCSMACRKQFFERPDGTYYCSKCDKWLCKENFHWDTDIRYETGMRRRAYCNTCHKQRVKNYHDQPQNKAKAHERHDTWRQRNLAEGGDKALRWYFARHMGAYRKRSKENEWSFDLTPDFLVELFHKQNGLCYYTNTPLDWDCWGKKNATANSMSVDRLNNTKGYTKDNVVLAIYAIRHRDGSVVATALCVKAQ